uniref:Uncharacterized protein n=1 Tax=Aegilops tauschii subsp. strangulata TaxID=200361 RepID=A0A453RE88_AEGTS
PIPFLAVRFRGPNLPGCPIYLVAPSVGLDAEPSLISAPLARSRRSNPPESSAPLPCPHSNLAPSEPFKLPVAFQDLLEAPPPPRHGQRAEAAAGGRGAGAGGGDRDGAGGCRGGPGRQGAHSGG